MTVAWLAGARQGLARQAGHGTAGLVPAAVRLGVARQAPQGWSVHGVAWRSLARHGRRGSVSLGTAWAAWPSRHGVSCPGATRRGPAGQARRGPEKRGGVRRGGVRLGAVRLGAAGGAWIGVASSGKAKARRGRVWQARKRSEATATKQRPGPSQPTTKEGTSND